MNGRAAVGVFLLYLSLLGGMAINRHMVMETDPGGMLVAEFLLLGAIGSVLVLFSSVKLPDEEEK